jgi:hypothetical protein
MMTHALFWSTSLDILIIVAATLGIIKFSARLPNGKDLGWVATWLGLAMVFWTLAEGEANHDLAFSVIYGLIGLGFAVAAARPALRIVIRLVKTAARRH